MVHESPLRFPNFATPGLAKGWRVRPIEEAPVEGENAVVSDLGRRAAPKRWGGIAVLLGKIDGPGR